MISELQVLKNQAKVLSRMYRKVYSKSDRDSLWEFSAALSLFMCQADVIDDIQEAIETYRVPVYGPLVDSPSGSYWTLTEALIVGEAPGLSTHAPIQVKSHVIWDPSPAVFKEVISLTGTTYQNCFASYLDIKEVALDVVVIQNPSTQKYKEVWITLDGLDSTSFTAYMPPTGRGQLEEFFEEMLQTRHNYVAPAFYDAMHSYLSSLD